jgi:DNA-binding response OmpR family regulator
VTSSQRFLDAVTSCFGDDTNVVSFSDDKALIRALARDMFEAILMEASDTASLRESRPLFVSRHCQSRLPVPLILVGHFANRAALDLAFSLGADDIVRLPIDQDELFVRTSRAIRRAQQDPVVGETLRLAEYRLEKRIGVVVFNGQTVQLTPREFAIAWMLFSRPGHYLSRKQISIAIWGCGEEVAGRTLEQHIYKLRKKLLLSGAHGVRLSTQYAHGYRVETFANVDTSHHDDDREDGQDGAIDPDIQRHRFGADVRNGGDVHRPSNGTDGYRSAAPSDNAEDADSPRKACNAEKAPLGAA